MSDLGPGTSVVTTPGSTVYYILTHTQTVDGVPRVTPRTTPYSPITQTVRASSARPNSHLELWRDGNTITFHGGGAQNNAGSVYGSNNTVNFHVETGTGRFSIFDMVTPARNNRVTMHGGTGHDEYICFSRGGHFNTFNGGAGNDRFTDFGRGNQNTVNGDTGNDSCNIQGEGNTTVFDGGSGEDHMFVSGKGNTSTFRAGEDNDTFEGRGEDNTTVVFGGTGNDTFILDGRNCTYTLNGEEGDDTFLVRPGQNNRLSIDGGTGTNRLQLQGIAADWEMVPSRFPGETSLTYRHRTSGTVVVARNIGQDNVSFLPPPPPPGLGRLGSFDLELDREPSLSRFSR